MWPSFHGQGQDKYSIKAKSHHGQYTGNEVVMVNPRVGMVNPIETIVELANSPTAKNVVNPTTDLVDPIAVETRQVDSIVEDVVDT